MSCRLVSFRDLPRVPWKPNTTIELNCAGHTIDFVSRQGRPQIPAGTTLRSMRCNLRWFVDNADAEDKASAGSNMTAAQLARHGQFGAAPGAVFESYNGTYQVNFEVRALQGGRKLPGRSFPHRCMIANCKDTLQHAIECAMISAQVASRLQPSLLIDLRLNVNTSTELSDATMLQIGSVLQLVPSWATQPVNASFVVIGAVQARNISRAWAATIIQLDMSAAWDGSPSVRRIVQNSTIWSSLGGWREAAPLVGHAPDAAAKKSLVFDYKGDPAVVQNFMHYYGKPNERSNQKRKLVAGLSGALAGLVLLGAQTYACVLAWHANAFGVHHFESAGKVLFPCGTDIVGLQPEAGSRGAHQRHVCVMI